MHNGWPGCGTIRVERSRVRDVLTPIETEKLVRQALAGDAGSFGKLVRAHYRAAYCTALSVVRSREDALDVVQEAMTDAFVDLESCRDPSRFSGWLLAVVRNRAMAYARSSARRRRRSEPEREDAPASAQTGDVLLRERLLAAAEALPPRQAEVLFLHDLEGWTHSEIAQALGTSEVNSRQLLFDARRKMRARLEAVDGKDGSFPGKEEPHERK